MSDSDLKHFMELSGRLRADLDDARTQLEAHNDDLDRAREELALRARDVRETRVQLDAAMKLLERALNDRQHPGGSWADQCEDLLNAIAQKLGG